MRNGYSQRQIPDLPHQVCSLAFGERAIEQSFRTHIDFIFGNTMLLRLSNRLPMEVFLIGRFSRQKSKIGLVNSKNAKRGLIQRICRLTWLKFQLISLAEEDDKQAADSYHSASIHQYALDPCLLRAINDVHSNIWNQQRTFGIALLAHTSRQLSTQSASAF